MVQPTDPLDPPAPPGSAVLVPRLRRRHAVTGAALPEGLAGLYDRHARCCLALACRVLGDADRAEAVVSAAFLDAWRDLTTGGPLPGPAGRWLARRTHWYAVTRLRADRTGPPPTLPVAGTADALRALPADRARALGWAMWDGCTAQDIAAMTGTPLREVRAALLAGVRELVPRSGPTAAAAEFPAEE